ncbi:hypothetical protein ASF03_13740 [Rhizobium sp. Leaf68]|nr:hypothetical protein ASE62_13060 [Rhizobium sp. Leaf202]KQN84312.1 hypothetical protein ASF03_13740 [Rhizobium sp. Leaf68]
MRKVVIAATAAGISLSGCVSAERSAANINDQGVTIADVGGAIKCAYAEALEREEKKDQRLRRLDGRVAVVELTLKVIDTSSFTGNANAQAAGPFLVTTNTGPGSILPRFGGSKTLTNTIQTVIKYRLGLEYGDYSVCKVFKRNQKLDYGFSNWLATLIEGLDTYALYEPTGSVDSAEYDGNFQIVRKVSGGVKFDIVFVGGDVGASQDNDYTQHIKMTIQPPTDKVLFPRPGEPNVGKSIRRPPVNAGRPKIPPADFGTMGRRPPKDFGLAPF